MRKSVYGKIDFTECSLAHDLADLIVLCLGLGGVPSLDKRYFDLLLDFVDNLRPWCQVGV